MIKYMDGMAQMDFERVTEMLSKAFWSVGIEKDEVIKGASHSALVVGAYCDERQIGYARVVSDKTRFAYLTDVYVDEAYRKQGVGGGILHYILEHPALGDVYQWLLITRDAHRLYEKCGFSRTERPLDWMEIKMPRPQRNKK